MRGIFLTAREADIVELALEVLETTTCGGLLPGGDVTFREFTELRQRMHVEELAVQEPVGLPEYSQWVLTLQCLLAAGLAGAK